MSDEVLVRCERLEIGHGRALLPAIDLELRRGHVLGVLGRNGAGKSTWLKTVLGWMPPVSGRVIRPPGLRAAHVPQVASLDALLPVRARDVVAWGRLEGWRFLRWPSREDRHAVEKALVEAEAVRFADHPYAELSEGQKQRVLFARLLAAEADLLLLDEPTAAMDPVAERAAYAQLRELARRKNVAVVVISHAVSALVRACDELLWLDREQDGGHVVSGACDVVLHHPAFVGLYGDIHVEHA